MHREGVGVLTFSLTLCVLDEGLALSRVLKKLPPSMAADALTVVGGPDLQDSAGILFLHAGWLSGCRCWLHVAFSGSFFFFLSGKVILAQMVTQKVVLQPAQKSALVLVQCCFQ